MGIQLPDVKGKRIESSVVTVISNKDFLYVVKTRHLPEFLLQLAPYLTLTGLIN